jgi:hypothetical protein
VEINTIRGIQMKKNYEPKSSQHKEREGNIKPKKEKAIKELKKKCACMIGLVKI